MGNEENVAYNKAYDFAKSVVSCYQSITSEQKEFVLSKRAAMRSESSEDAVTLTNLPKRAAMRSESSEDAVTLTNLPKRSAMRSELTWTHYKILMRVENDKAREWYMNETADQHWSTRQLDRQISALYYEHLLASREKKPVIKEANEKMAKLEPENSIYKK